jgi:5-formyltetrahydrofolate cyclo-ligase
VTTSMDKTGWRATVRAARRQLSDHQLATAALALRTHLLPRLAGARRVAAYVPVGAEPGSVQLLDELAWGGTTVLLPVVDGEALWWAMYGGADDLVDGQRGMRAPGGRRLAADSLRLVDAVLVPAQAVDHVGTRLGRGAGHYDRALAAASPGTPLIALLHDGELVPQLPVDPWDRRVTAVSTPGAGWTELPLVAHHVH